MADRRLLIIDDSMVDRAILAYMLEPKYKVDEAENGFEGMEKVLSKEREYDCILLDLHMPILDGFHVLQLLKENNVDIPVIVITAESTEANIFKTMSYNVADFICKPYDSKVILPRLENILLEREILQRKI